MNNNKKITIEADKYILSSGCINNNVILLNTFKSDLNYLNKYNIGKNLSFHPSCNLGKILFKKNKLYSYLKKDIDYSYFSPLSGGIDFYGDVLFTSENQIKENPERVKRWKENRIKRREEKKWERK